MDELYPEASQAELEVLKILWDQGTATVRELHQLLRKQRRRWAYNTVLTLLSRLREKGYVASYKHGTAYVFRAAVSRDEMLRQRMTDLANQVCDGAASPLVLALVEGKHLKPADMIALREILDRLDKE